MDLKQANIANLMALWKCAGQLAGSYVEQANYCLSLSTNGAWPNKLWFNQMLNMQLVQQIPNSCKVPAITIPLWGENINKHELILKVNGYEEKMTQTGMSMLLESKSYPTCLLSNEKVSNKKQAKIWSRLFLEAFGYEISVETVTLTMNVASYYIGFYNDKPVGTAALFIDQNGIAGIHSMGIIPSERKKGFAAEMLHHMLRISKEKGASYVTLQASEAGKHLYIKTGFQEDFTLKTFVKTNNNELNR